MHGVALYMYGCSALSPQFALSMCAMTVGTHVASLLEICTSAQKCCYIDWYSLLRVVLCV